MKLPETRNRVAACIRIGLGEANDVACMLLSLTSDASKHVNAAEMVVDNADTVVYTRRISRGRSR